MRNLGTELEFHPIGNGVFSTRDCPGRQEYGRTDAFEFYYDRPVPQGLTRQSPLSDTPPLYDATFISYAGGRRIPGAVEYRIELDRVR